MPVDLQQNNRINQFLEELPENFKKLLKTAFPITGVRSLIQLRISIITPILLKELGENKELSAYSIIGTYLGIMFGFGIPASSAVATLVAQSNQDIPEENTDDTDDTDEFINKLNYIFNTGLIEMVLWAGVVSALMWEAESISTSLGADKNLANIVGMYTKNYVKLGLPFFTMINVLIEQVLHALGKGKVPMFVTAFRELTDTVLSVLMLSDNVRKILPFKLDKDIRVFVYSNAIVELAEVAYLTYYIRKNKNVLKLKFLIPSLKEMIKTFNHSVFGGIRNFSVIISDFIMVSIVTSKSQASLALFNIGKLYLSFATVLNSAVPQAVGYQKVYDTLLNAKKMQKWSFLLMGIPIALVSIPYTIASKAIVKTLIDEKDELIEIGQGLLIMEILWNALSAYGHSFRGPLQGNKKFSEIAYSSFISVSTIAIPLMFIFAETLSDSQPIILYLMAAKILSEFANVGFLREIFKRTYNIDNLIDKILGCFSDTFSSTNNLELNLSSDDIEASTSNAEQQEIRLSELSFTHFKPSKNNNIETTSSIQKIENTS